LAILALPAAASASPHSGDVKHKVGKGTSTNWSGYAVPGTNATDVKGSWIQPAATCSKRESSWSSPWVGIDGDNSNTVEQIGTDTDCSGGVPRYYAWYEMYPKSLVVINIPIKAGDSFSAEVSTSGNGSYTMTLTNNSATPAPTTYTTVQAGSKTQNSSIEWVMEGPSNGSLTNFGTVGFTGASGTIGGTTAGVDGFAAADPIIMVGKRGIQRAVPTTASGSAFAVNWLHS
jgi:peptidase A4-like protein